MFHLADVKKIIHKWLFLENDRIVDVMLATYVSNKLNTDPLWTIFIAPPSSTKTELLRSLSGHKGVYFLSNLTPSTLVSGLLAKKGRDDPSLLLKLDGKTLILKDFTTVLAMRSEQQQEILSQLREIYDGQYSKVFGNGKEVSWSGHVGLMAACTPYYDSHYGIINILGDRFLLYRTHTGDNEELGLRAQKIVGRESEMRKEIKSVIHKFIDQFHTIEDLNFKHDDAVNQMIVTLACFCAYGRCAVEREYRDKHIKYLPLPEGSARLVKQFMQIGMGLALVRGKKIIDVDVYETIKKIGRDLLPAQRLKILRYLWEEKAFAYLLGKRRTTEITDAVEIPSATTRLILEDLMVVGLLNRERAKDGETTPYEWQLTQQACDMIDGSQLFEITKDEPF